MPKKLLALPILTLWLALGCAGGETTSLGGSDEPLESRPIPDVAAEHDGLLTLLAALDSADLLDTLASEGPFTLFAPTDEAFAKIPKEDLDALLTDTDALREVLLYHVVAEPLTEAEVLASSTLTTVQGDEIAVQMSPPALNGNVGFIETDVIAGNGVIHLIDTVLLPPEPAPEPEPKTIVDIAVGDDRFETLVTALGVADLVETLQGEGPFTVFAPTNEAFAKLPAETLDALLHDPDALREILLYHVVPGDLRLDDVLGATALTTVQGDDITVDAAAGTLNGDTGLVEADIVASNGVIHAIDMVLLPPEPEPKTIVDIAIEDGRFHTLVEALHAAHLVETLQGEGPFTVFAPTDEAFHRLPKALLKSLFLFPSSLRAVLLYHVVPGDLASGDVLAAHTLETLQGASIDVSAHPPTLNDDIGFVELDIEASNGVLHVIDGVLIPPVH